MTSLPWPPIDLDDVHPPQLDTTTAHAARIANYFLGGKDNYPIDREPAEEIMTVFPSTITTAIQNRAFLSRAVRMLAGDVGIRQFVDIGTGLPVDKDHFGGPKNLHEIAQDIDPTARVVYVDNDPLVLLHARALMPSAPEGIVSVIDWDLRDPASIFKKSELTKVLDLDQPIALSLGSILHFFPDPPEDSPDKTDQNLLIRITPPAELVARLVDWLAPGSYLTISHGAADFAPCHQALVEHITKIYKGRGIPLQLRTRAQVEALVPIGLQIIEPGVVLLHHWQPDGSAAVPDGHEVAGYGLVARKA